MTFRIIRRGLHLQPLVEFAGEPPHQDGKENPGEERFKLSSR